MFQPSQIRLRDAGPMAVAILGATLVAGGIRCAGAQVVVRDAVEIAHELCTLDSLTDVQCVEHAVGLRAAVAQRRAVDAAVEVSAP
jgi:hypothetical protein